MVAYTVSIYSLSQMKKDAKKCGNPKTVSLALNSELEWDAWKAKMLVKIDSVLKPTNIIFEDYILTFTIPRVHPKATSMDDEDSYKFMVGRASKGKDPNVSITVEPILPDVVSLLSIRHNIF
jgi:hypothetical protein